MRLSIALATLLAVSTAAVSAHAASDRTFLKKAIEGDNSEMTLGQMAEQKGASAGVRAFGRMLYTDHSQSKQEVVPIARAHGVPATDALQPAAIAERRKLSHLSGPAFDHEFASYMVKDHRQDISDFEKQTHSGAADVANLARSTLPVLHKHLATAESLLR